MSTHFAFTPLPPTHTDARKPAAVAALAGTWRGELIDETGIREIFTLLRDGSHDSAVAGRFLFFATHDIPPTGVRLLEASATAFVALIGPYFDPHTDADVVTVLEGVRRNEDIEGSFYTKAQNWRNTLRSGHFIAKRMDATHRAA
jgi:hypothetical protein